MSQPQITLPFDPLDLLLAIAANTIVMLGHFATAMPWWGWPIFTVAVLHHLTTPSKKSRP